MRIDSIKPNLEIKEKAPDFDLVITLTRHGPKEGRDGELSEKGKEETENYFTEAYENVSIDTSRKRKVLTSRKIRAIQTTQIYQKVLERDHGVEPTQVETINFLNEGETTGEMMSYYHSLEGKDKERYEKYLLDGDEKVLKSGEPNFKKNRQEFYSWMIREINELKKEGGNEDVDGISHGPVIQHAILNSLQSLLREKIYPDNNKQEKSSRYSGKINLLQNINFHISSKEPNIVKLHAFGKTISMPIEKIEQLAKDEII